MAIEQQKPSIEKYAYQKFMDSFKKGQLGTQRLGQAIVNTDLSDMTVSKCLQLAELSRQQRPQCFGEENRPSAGLNKNESYATRS